MTDRTVLALTEIADEIIDHHHTRGYDEEPVAHSTIRERLKFERRLDRPFVDVHEVLAQLVALVAAPRPPPADSLGLPPPVDRCLHTSRGERELGDPGAGLEIAVRPVQRFTVEAAGVPLLRVIVPEVAATGVVGDVENAFLIEPFVQVLTRDTDAVLAGPHPGFEVVVADPGAVRHEDLDPCFHLLPHRSCRFSCQNGQGRYDKYIFHE